MITDVLVILLSFVAGFNGVPVERTTVDLSQFFTQRIIGGIDAPEAYAPHMVALVGGNFIITVGCGGSIISKKHILTAAHCIEFYVVDGKIAPTFHGRVGSNQWHSGGTRVDFESFSIHPKYDAVNVKYDVGVLQMAKELGLSEKVDIIPPNYKIVDGGHRSYVTGWGVTGPRFEDDSVHLAPIPDNLQLLYVDTISAPECVKAMALLGWMPPVNPEVEICTLHSPRHGMCNGDSGSGLVSVQHGNLIGIVSWGEPCATGTPDVFVRISGIKDYLEFFLNS